MNNSAILTEAFNPRKSCVLNTHTHTHSTMSHVVLWRLRPDGVLCGERDAAQSDDGQDAELKVLQRQDVVTAFAKPAAKDTHRSRKNGRERKKYVRCAYHFT